MTSLCRGEEWIGEAECLLPASPALVDVRGETRPVLGEARQAGQRNECIY